MGFIFVLVEAINPGSGKGTSGIEGARDILKYLRSLGNYAAAKRLAEIDSMCSHLSLSWPGGRTPPRQRETTDPRILPSIERGMAMLSSSEAEAEAVDSSQGMRPSIHLAQQDATSSQLGFPQNELFNNSDMTNISLEGEDLYWMFHTPDFAFTGVDDASWGALDSNINWNP